MGADNEPQFRDYIATLQNRMKVLECIANANWGSESDPMTWKALPDMPKMSKSRMDSCDQVLPAIWSLRNACITPNLSGANSAAQNLKQHFSVLAENGITVEKFLGRYGCNLETCEFPKDFDKDDNMMRLGRDCHDVIRKFVLSQLLQSELGSMTAKPVDSEKMACLRSIEMQLMHEVYLCADEDAVKRTTTNLKDILAVMGGVKNGVSRACQDLRKAKDSKKRKAEQHAEKQRKAEAKKMAKSAKEVTTAMSKKAGEKSACPLVEDGIVERIAIEMRTFDSETKFQEAIADDCKQYGDGLGRPYCIKQSQAFVDLCTGGACPALKSMLEIFRAQYPQSAQCSKTGRCQANLSLAAEHMDIVQKALTPLIPPFAKVADSMKGNIALFGFSPTMSFIGCEFQALGTMRFQWVGARILLVASFAELWKCVPDTDKSGPDNFNEGYNVTHFLSDLLSTKASSDAGSSLMTALASNGTLFELVEVEAGDVVYIPAGSIVAERVQKGNLCAGIRMTVEDCGSGGSGCARKNLESLCAEHEARCKAAGESKLLALWKSKLS
jgi:hypothetical protein